MSAEPEPNDRRAVAAIVAGLVVVALLVIGYVATRPDAGDVAEGDPTATTTATSGTEEPSATQAPATMSPTPVPTTAPSPTSQPAAGQPTEADVEEFVTTYGPAEQQATGDVDGDGFTDVVVASRRDETTWIDVGFWDGESFAHHADEGGPAESIEALTVEDFNGVQGAEIVTEQSVGEAGSSLSVWGGSQGRLERQSGEGGCWDGFHTYGISGATIEPGRITATCDGSPLPPEGWTRDVYEWDGAWRYVESIPPED